MQGYLRLPARQCLPPIIKLLTAAGTIYIEGSSLEFSEAVAPVFLEAGLLTEPSNPMGTRRRLVSGDSPPPGGVVVVVVVVMVVEAGGSSR